MVLSNYIPTVVPRAGPLGGAPRRHRSPQRRTTRQERALLESRARFGDELEKEEEEEEEEEEEAMVVIMSAHMNGVAPRTLPRRISHLEELYELADEPAAPRPATLPPPQPQPPHPPAPPQLTAQPPHPTAKQDHDNAPSVSPPRIFVDRMPRSRSFTVGYSPKNVTVGMSTSRAPGHASALGASLLPSRTVNVSAYVPVSPATALQMAQLGMRSPIKPPVPHAATDFQAKWGEHRVLSPSVTRGSGALPRRHNPHLQAPVDGIGPGTNW